MIYNKTKYTPEEYLAREEQAEYRSEYYDGEIRMMAGGTENHSIISVTTATTLSLAVREKPCRVFNSDMRLLIATRESYTYPDVMVICGKTILQEGRTDVVTNPIVIVEVLSASTRERDRIEKFKLYKQIESLREYVLIDSERLVVSILRRQQDSGQWMFEVLNAPTDILILESIGIEIPLTELYAKIDFPATDDFSI